MLLAELVTACGARTTIEGAQVSDVDASGGSAGSATCPGTGGPTAVRLPQGYCIDSTEVTRGQYQLWLATNPTSDGQISGCQWNTSFVPDAECMAGPNVYSGPGSENHPQTCVDWCDAYSYCKGVGKRLCGKIGGGTNDFGNYANSSLSQWYNACVSDGTNNAYPFGTTYGPNLCNGYDHGIGTTVPVGEMKSCQSPISGYAGVYDLSGNVWEWEDSCNGSDPEARCRLRGGTIYYNDYGLKCDYGDHMYRNVAGHVIGLRCCS
jgi:sulfatase modifying factor 1